MSKQLPSRPSLDHLKHQARNLQRDHAAANAEALERVQKYLPGQEGPLALAKAQTVIAREYGSDSWPKLKAAVEQADLARHQAEQSASAGLPADSLAQAVEAVRTCDFAALSDLLRRHPGLLDLSVNEDGRNLLHEACCVNPLAIGRSSADVIRVVDLLLDAGIDLNAPVILEDEPELPLRAPWYCVARAKSAELLRHLLEKGANPNGCLFAASPDLIPILHEFGADLNESADDETPLLHALKSRNLDSVRALLEVGAEVNRADSKGGTPLHYAVRQYHEADVLELLLEHGASPDLPSARDVTALGLATQMGREDAVEKLAAHSQDPSSARQVRAAESESGAGSDDVGLQAWLNIEGSDLRAIVAWYEKLGFVCEGMTMDGPWAKLALEDATFMFSTGGQREQSHAETLIYRCPPAAFSKLREALDANGVAYRADAAESLTLTDCCGFELRFESERDRSALSIEPCLFATDVAKTREWYESVGFEQSDEDGPGDGLRMQKGSARIQIRQGEPVHSGPKAVHLWLNCSGFDRLYHHVRGQMTVDPPQVAFHGIFFSVDDPDGHKLTFNGPATDI